MPTKEDLLNEKRKYGLKEIINLEELKLLEQNVPIQHIMGYVDFLGINIKVNKNVLIPRYETMELVDLFLKKYAKNNTKILDLCTGSGCIGIKIKKDLPGSEVILSDISLEALKIAKENCLNNLNADELKGISILHSNLFEKINNKFDVIISNPPYLNKKDTDIDESVKQFEPHIALFADDNGWAIYEQILSDYKKFLNKNGILIMEINPKHESKWKNIKNAHLIKDINNKYRFVVFK
ncbi:peptide chain release factor N(5)-glutamine methyltransferase [Mycoplasmopsis lipofaciens]|uniref:peptide chain release factor N(5)-glutamine methyltransferase n=1 Tax=Mycoplasmopsis lipofaciens TaxID=114884 RepID=UPI00048A2635|nr:peptide chain release factor N(5)-glutamine methyltransferase [Mycoplasmopsis lipofaciens]